MAQFNYFGSGNPSNVPSPADALANYFDTLNNSLWLSAGNGWVPQAGSLVAFGNALAQTANNANVLTYNVVASGIFQISLYEISANTPTGATLPAITVTYTDNETGSSVTFTLASEGSVSAQGVVNQGQAVINPKVGTNVVFATTSYAAGSGTALSYNVKVRMNRM
jgi:hypothetical protein